VSVILCYADDMIYASLFTQSRGTAELLLRVITVASCRSLEPLGIRMFASCYWYALRLGMGIDMTLRRGLGGTASKHAQPRPGESVVGVSSLFDRDGGHDE